MSDLDWKPVTHDSCGDVPGPFYHGTKYRLETGELLVPGHASNFEAGRISNNVYFSALLEPAVWGAELATALAGVAERGHIYIVEPTGPFEDDPNLTDKKFPGNPTASYRSRAPLRIVGEVAQWEGHSPERLKEMKDFLARLAAEGDMRIID